MNSSGLDRFYKSRIHSGSIILVRPAADDGYEILLMKRHPKIIFGGFYAFSGGKVEEQDHYDHWRDNYPEMFKHFALRLDFSTRICAIRETFEEIGRLLVRPIGGGRTSELGDLRKGYSGDFLSLCKSLKVVPALDEIYGYRRVSTGNTVVPGLDNQFYVCFPNEPYDDESKLEEQEFTEGHWLTPD